MRRAHRRYAARSAAALCRAVLCCSAFAWSCGAQPVSGFRWLDQDGKELAFLQSERRPSGKEGLFDESSKANRFVLSSPVLLPAGRAIAVDVELEARAAAGGPATSDPAAGSPAAAPGTRVVLGLSAEDDGDPSILEAAFPLLSRSARFYLRPKAGSTIASLYARTAGGEPFRIVGVSMPAGMAGIEEAEGRLSVSSGFRLAIGAGSRELSIESPFEGTAASAGADASSRPGLVVSYGPEAPGAGSGSRSGTGGTISIEARRAGGGVASMTLRMGPGGRRTVIGPELIPYDATRIDARAPEGRSIGEFRVGQVEARDYELADLGRVLAAQAVPGGEDYLLYRWDALPSVLVLVFKDYDAQDRYLKRLAFFIEKAGYRGRLHPDSVIGPLHGWNAHDYRPEDLAAFFAKAAAEGFPLSSQEKALGGLLEARGILAKRGGKIEPGEGALISISLETAPATRRTLLVHESTHAIFFADEEYRAHVRQVWASIGEDEKWFWKAYFGWAAYDTGSEYLMANEFQAYLLQQPLSSVREYFTERKPEELLAKHEELRPRVEEYMRRYGSSFEARARDLDGWVSRKYGFAAGRTYFLDIGK